MSCLHWLVTSIAFDIPIEEDDDVIANARKHAALCAEHNNTVWAGHTELDVVCEIQKESGELISSITLKRL